MARSIQFNLPGFDAASIDRTLAAARARGVELKWFGAEQPHGLSKHDSWTHAGAQHLPRTDLLLTALTDMRLPLTISLNDCRSIGQTIRECVLEAGARSVIWHWNSGG